VVKLVGFLEDHAHVVQAGDEGRSVDLLAAAGPVAEADDVGAVLLEPGGEGEALGVVRERYKSGLAIRIISGSSRNRVGSFQSFGSMQVRIFSRKYSSSR
jgi:hypothetical protein